MRERNQIKMAKNFKGIQCCKLLLSYSNQSTAAINICTFILFNFIRHFMRHSEIQSIVAGSGSGSYC